MAFYFVSRYLSFHCLFFQLQGILVTLQKMCTKHNFVINLFSKEAHMELLFPEVLSPLWWPNEMGTCQLLYGPPRANPLESSS